MLSNEVVAYLQDALASVRAFADQAEMAIERHEDTHSGCNPEMIIGQVQAKLAWGLANASSSIRDALSTVTYERERDNA